MTDLCDEMQNPMRIYHRIFYLMRKLEKLLRHWLSKNVHTNSTLGGPHTGFSAGFELCAPSKNSEWALVEPFWKVWEPNFGNGFSEMGPFSLFGSLMEVNKT